MTVGLAVRVFANGPGDLGSIRGRVIPKTQKMVLDASFLNTQHYKVRIKGKVEQSREGVAPSPTPWCSSYRKGSLRVTLDYGRQLYLLTLENMCSSHSSLLSHWISTYWSTYFFLIIVAMAFNIFIYQHICLSRLSLRFSAYLSTYFFLIIVPLAFSILINIFPH